VSATPRDRAKALFGERQLAEAVVAVLNGDAVGFALYYPTYSTVLGREGIHLEALYVSDQYRGLGIGQILLQHLAELANRRGAECADRASSGRGPGSWRRRLRTGRQRLRRAAFPAGNRTPTSPAEVVQSKTMPRPASRARNRRLKTWSSLSQLGRIPSEYEGVTHNLNYTTRPNRNSALESNPTAPANMWLLTYRDRSP
jgi:GNAT superfamily N-acetyltransferase